MTGWEGPTAGRFAVAVPTRDYSVTVCVVEGYFGRELAHYTYALSHEGGSYAIFFFIDEADANAAVSQFNGEPFDARQRSRTALDEMV